MGKLHSSNWRIGALSVCLGKNETIIKYFIIQLTHGFDSQWVQRLIIWMIYLHQQAKPHFCNVCQYGEIDLLIHSDICA